MLVKGTKVQVPSKHGKPLDVVTQPVTLGTAVFLVVSESIPLSAALRDSVRFFAGASGDHVAFTQTRAVGRLVPFPLDLDCIQACSAALAR